MSTLNTYTSGTRPAASGNTGLCIFRTDTNAMEVSDGFAWQIYNSDGVSYTAISNAYSIDLDGAGDYLDFGTTSVISTSSAFSISTWFKLDDWQDGYPGICLLKTGGTSGFVVSLSQTSDYSGVWFGSSSGFSGFSTNNSSLASTIASGWHHLALSYDGVSATTASSFTLYIDGTEYTAATGVAIGACPNNNYIGLGHNASITYLDGLMDEFTLYNFELTSANVSYLYNNGNPTSPDILNPVGWWRMGDTGTEGSSNSSTVSNAASGSNSGGSSLNAALQGGALYSTTVPS